MEMMGKGDDLRKLGWTDATGLKNGTAVVITGLTAVPDDGLTAVPDDGSMTVVCLGLVWLAATGATVLRFSLT